VIKAKKKGMRYSQRFEGRKSTKDKVGPGLVEGKDGLEFAVEKKLDQFIHNRTIESWIQ